MNHEWRRKQFLISTDKSRLNVDVIHTFLKTSYWVPDIPRRMVLKTIENTLNFGVYDDMEQIGYASVVTDYSNFAYVQNIFVLQNFQGYGLGQWLMETISTCPALKDVRRLILVTRDAQEFYRKCGFQPLSNPDGWLEMLFERPW